MEKTIEFQNKAIAPLANFLNKLKLKNMASLGRTKLINLLSAKNDEYQADLEELRSEFFEKDDDGEYKTTTNELNQEVYVYKDPSSESEHEKHVNSISDDKAVITISEHLSKMETLYQALKSYDDPFSEQDALLYEILMNELENNFETKEVD